MEMRVFCIGETVFDIIFQEDKPVAAKPGGSMLNSAVSLGRAGIPVHLITDFANDHAGNMVFNFLRENGVSTDYIDRYDDGKTALALAFLDEQQNAAYTFYREFPGERLRIEMPAVEPGDIILFGSYYALTESLRKTLATFIRRAKSNGAFIIYDPNFRKPHLSELALLKPLIIENISLANLVRGSNEDFSLIFGTSTGVEAFEYVQQAGCSLLVYTKNKEGVELFAPGEHLVIPVPAIDPVSTIGAGDAFNAGIIYALTTTPAGWSWETILRQGICFAEDVCLHLDNYISVELGRELDRTLH